MKTPQEILVDFFNEAEVDVHSDKFVNGTVYTHAATNVLNDLYELMLEVIGDDERTNRYRTITRNGQQITDCKGQSHNWSRNTLRKEMRKRLNELFGRGQS